MICGRSLILMIYLRTFNPQTTNGVPRGPDTHSKLPFNFHPITTMLSVFLENIVLNIPLLFYEYVATKASPSDIWIKAWLKGPKWASQAQVLFSTSDCLCCWQPNITTLKDKVYMSSKTVCHKIPTGLQWQPGIILMQLLQLLLDSNGQDFNVTQKANLGLRGLHCFGMVYEKCTIYFDPYSLVLIVFYILFIELNMISNISLIVTNI